MRELLTRAAVVAVGRHQQPAQRVVRARVDVPVQVGFEPAAHLGDVVEAVGVEQLQMGECKTDAVCDLRRSAGRAGTQSRDGPQLKGIAVSTRAQPSSRAASSTRPWRSAARASATLPRTAAALPILSTLQLSEFSAARLDEPTPASHHRPRHDRTPGGTLL